MSEPFWLSREEVRELDRRAIDGFGVPGIVLMENAGRGCAELLMRLNPERKPTVILCGPGNNGGDGFVIARHLDNHGWPVDIFACEPFRPVPDTKVRLGFDFGGLPPNAETNYRIAQSSQVQIFPLTGSGVLWPGAQSTLWNMLKIPRTWVIDALFGTGLNRELDTPFDEMIALLNAAITNVLAVDIPSGLDCDSGEPLGPTVRAAHTATFVAHKKGFLNPRSREWTGEVHVVDIGAPRVLVDEYRRRREG